MKEKRDKFELYREAKTIAAYYGFQSLPALFAQLENPGRAIKIPETFDRPTLMKLYMERNLGTLPQPLLVYHSEPLGKHMDPSAYGGAHGVQFSLEIIGAPRSIAEAILLKTALVIMTEAGFTDISVELNNLGDRESLARFNREFTAYFRKHISEMQTHCREALKKNIFKVLACEQEKCQPLKENAPRPISALSEASRSHFTEVLEYVESMQIPYVVNTCLIGGQEYYTKTIFSLKTESTQNERFPDVKFDPVLARGARYDELARILGYKKEIPAVGISISLGGLGLVPEPVSKKDTLLRARGGKTRICLIHLGFEAKVRSLGALELLRRARVPIFQTLSKDRLSVQIAAAERLSVTHTVIIGQKEALEGTAIVRDMSTRAQETVALLELAQYLKNVI